MTKGKVDMPAIQRVAVLGFSLLFFAVSQQANAQQKMEFKFNLQDLLPAGKQETAPDQPVRPAENQAVPVEQKSPKAATLEARRAAELEARRAKRQKIFNEIQESEKKQLESNVALAETFVSDESAYWMHRAEKCQQVMLKIKQIPKMMLESEKVAAIADETMECLWSLESELRSKGELARLESCFAETFEKLPARARAETLHGVLVGGEYVISGGMLTMLSNRKVKNEYGIQNRPLIYLDTMWRATTEPQSALSYTQIYKMLFFDVGVPKRELHKAEIARYQREKAMAERRYSPAILDRANEYLYRMAGPEGDAAESQEQTRARLAKFAECTPLGPMLGKPLSLIQRESGWTFAAANSVFEKRTEKIRNQKMTKVRGDYEKRMAEIREASLQDWRKGLRVDSVTNKGAIVAFSSDRTKAQVEMRRCSKWKKEEPEEFEWGYRFVCTHYIVTERSWKNISELTPQLPPHDDNAFWDWCRVSKEC